MLKQSTIDQVKSSMSIREVVGHFVPLKQDTACCPFHGEKTPSFRVTESKGIYKCFGCGAGGDAIKFVMEHERKTFYEAIIWLAEFYKIPVEYDATYEAKTPEQKDLESEMQAVVEYAVKFHKKALFHATDATKTTHATHALNYLKDTRGFDEDTIRKWELGFADGGWKTLTLILIEKGKYTAAEAAGIVRTNQGKTFDFLRNRITIPLHDRNGKLVGEAGRLLPSDKADDLNMPKYLNPKDSTIYNKKNIWFGLHHAAAAMKEMKYAYIVEGYFDVIAMHAHGIENTVAPCGTAIADEQVMLLKRYTEHVCFIGDNDEAGIKAVMKNINIFLKQGFKVSVSELPQNVKDADEYLRVSRNEATKATGAAVLEIDN